MEDIGFGDGVVCCLRVVFFCLIFCCSWFARSVGVTAVQH